MRTDSLPPQFHCQFLLIHYIFAFFFVVFAENIPFRVKYALVAVADDIVNICYIFL